MRHVLSILFIMSLGIVQFAHAISEEDFASKALVCVGAYNGKPLKFIAENKNRDGYFTVINLSAILNNQKNDLSSASFNMQRSDGSGPSVASFSWGYAQIRSTMEEFNGYPTVCPEGTPAHIGCVTPSEDSKRWVIDLNRNVLGNYSAQIKISSLLFGEKSHRMVSIDTECEMY